MAKFSFMLNILSAKEMREVDLLTTSKYGIPSILLMENAATSVVRAIEENLKDLVRKKILVLCGKGNNGGDGAASARLLWAKGAIVKVLLFGKVEETKGDARVNFEILSKLSGLKNGKFANKIEFHEAATLNELDEFDVIIDALFGTGLSRPVEGSLKELISVLFEAKASGRLKDRLIVSVDLPSGLDADNHCLIGDCVKADLTVTFTAPKIANVFPPASNYVGKLYIADIGSPSELVSSVGSRFFLTEREDVKIWLEKTAVRPDSYKKKRGRVLIIAGSDDFLGAAALAANSCFMAGAGMVWLAVPENIRQAIAPKLENEIIIRAFESIEKSIENSTFWEDFDCVAIGCGLQSSERMKEFLLKLIENRRKPIVLDAEALNLLSPFQIEADRNLPLILTPHIGEFRRLVGRELVESERIEVAKEFAERHKVILVLKGQRNLIASPDGIVVINPTGTAGISRAGAGDTLTGIISSFLAQTYAVEDPNFENTLEAVVSALYVSGLAAEIAAKEFSERLMTPYQAVKCLGVAIEKCSLSHLRDEI